MKQFRFITLEGCEGVGKTTQLNALKEYLFNTHQKCVFTREPGGTPLAEEIRKLILTNKMDGLTEAHLFAAARIEHINEIILPALGRGEIVVCDRYLDSSLAYQGFARGLGLDTVLEINRYAVEKCMPTVTVFLKLSPESNFRSKSGSVIENDKMEKENLDFHKKVYQGFLELEKLYVDRYITVEPINNKSATTQMIIDKLKERGLID